MSPKQAESCENLALKESMVSMVIIVSRLKGHGVGLNGVIVTLYLPDCVTNMEPEESTVMPGPLQEYVLRPAGAVII